MVPESLSKVVQHKRFVELRRVRSQIGKLHGEYRLTIKRVTGDKGHGKRIYGYACALNIDTVTLTGDLVMVLEWAEYAFANAEAIVAAGRA